MSEYGGFSVLGCMIWGFRVLGLDSGILGFMV